MNFKVVGYVILQVWTILKSKCERNMDTLYLFYLSDMKTGLPSRGFIAGISLVGCMDQEKQWIGALFYSIHISCLFIRYQDLFGKNVFQK